MQPFCPSLFTRGPPTGPARLIRKLAGKISSETAVKEWLHDSENPGAEEPSKNSTMEKTHRCTHCYLVGNKEYMYELKSFGISHPSEFFTMYLAQGSWTRCLKCQENIGFTIATHPIRSFHNISTVDEDTETSTRIYASAQKSFRTNNATPAPTDVPRARKHSPRKLGQKWPLKTTDEEHPACSFA